MMQDSRSLSLAQLPTSAKIAAWLTSFTCPTISFVLLPVLMSAMLSSGSSEWAESIFSISMIAAVVLIPATSLAICELLISQANLTPAWKAIGMISTLLAMILQLGMLFVVLCAIITTMISLP